MEIDKQRFRKELTPNQYRVAVQGATEPPFTGKYWDEKADGTYTCVCCNKELFDAKTKFKSGTGWPSFYQPISEDAVKLKEDKSGGMARVEVLCNNCAAHLGHVFEDGPPPTGQRYCLNSASLLLIDK